ncbi:MAG: tRNA uridine-5-carboxymethylaminomethyl(34) synthesis GTPase MnmE [Lachnospiraceae bacterium]|jgi:tRNA modification GTPase|nr:tRNA uridine-5-carboxymethylaminomethyl(34) synthesis GTPase MnmE [Lachnospiraceae bacterium]MEE3461754.1 tRNA uridine-5-carboxymethylaminomethyl(34) synthesis GTPase MnmE [Lachnospiraceae bacterium]
MKYHDDTIAAICSGTGGTIGIIRVSGSDALDVISRIFIPSGKNTPQDDFFRKAVSHTIHYGHITDQNGNILDEVLITVMKAPKTYTRDDVIEINTHGNSFILEKILKSLIQTGIRMAEPGEFTKRAFLNGRIDLSQAEAVMDVIGAKSTAALKNSVEELSGSLKNKISSIRKTLLDDLSFIEAGLDDPEHIDIEGYSGTIRDHAVRIEDQLKVLADSFDQGKVMQDGINVVIAGRPNSGKSSLLNLLSGKDSAIVTDIAGTTRDLIHENIRLDDILLNIYDTAGIRRTDDKIEKIGVDRSIKAIDNADLVLYAIDLNNIGPDGELDQKELNGLSKISDKLRSKRGIILFNKSDLLNMGILNTGAADNEITNEMITNICGHVITSIKNICGLDWPFLLFSAKTGKGLDELISMIKNMFYHYDLNQDEQIFITDIRQYNSICDAINSIRKLISTIDDRMPEDLYCIDITDAYNSLGLINGDTAAEDLIDNIFKNFCMGK